jgi:hypothetical protein
MTLNEEDIVYAWISIVTGQNVNPNGGSLQLNGFFYWANPAGVAVTLTGCGGFCVDSSYVVPSPPSGQTYGLKQAQLLASPGADWSFTENPPEWNVPGVPRIISPPEPSPLAENREVA